MKEEKVTKLTKPDMDAILADEVLVKKLAAKVLDIIQQKPDSGVVCQGYYCDMEKEVPIKELWAKKLNALDMKIEEGLAESAAEEYPLSADELDQVVTEIKTSDAYTEKLAGNDLFQAVGKVLADNEMIRRKGGMEVKKSDYRLLCSSGVRHDKYLPRIPEICHPLYALQCDYHERIPRIPHDDHPNWELETMVTKAVKVALDQFANSQALSRTTYR